MSVLTRATGRNIPQDAILHSHRRENLKSYMDRKIFGKSLLRDMKRKFYAQWIYFLPSSGAARSKS
jgi:hypothetical protein